MKKIFFSFFFILALSSCRKDVTIPEGKDFDGTVTPNVPFVPLTVGSFWVYNYYYTDTLGNETFWNTDTVQIIKDSIINGKTYVMFRGHYAFYNPNNVQYFRRDSSGYLVDNDGDIYFCYTNFIDTLATYADTITGCFMFAKMAHKDSLISVPAGTFVASKYEITEIYPSSWPWQKIRNGGQYYSSGVGIIKSRTHYSGSPSYIDSKLVNYYIAP